MKLLETSTLIHSADSRLKAYQKTRDEMAALKQQFHDIANMDAMTGRGADAIKAFYNEQASGAGLWLDLFDMKISFFKSIPREIEQAGFGQNDLLEESFLESELEHAGGKARHIIDGQHDEISRILRSIDDILPLSPFDKSAVTGKLDAAEHKKRQTAEHLHKLDAKLLHEYAESEALEHEADAFFRTLADLTSKAGGPMAFNAKAFYDTDVYKRKADIQKQAHQYIKIKQQEETAFLQKKLDRTTDPDEYVNIAEELGADNMSAEQLQYYSSLVQLKAMRQTGQMLIDGAKGITLGIWDAGKDAVIGAYDIAVWLQRAQGRAGAIEQAKAGQELISTVYSAPETFDYMVQSFKTSWNDNIIHGDTYSRTHYIAYAVASLIGAKGVGKVTGVTKAGKFVTNEAKTFIADQKNVAKTISKKTKPYFKGPHSNQLNPALQGAGSIESPLMKMEKGLDKKQESVVRIDGGEHGGKGNGNLTYKEGYYAEHLTGEVKKCTKRHGVSGGHNYDEFKKYFHNNGQYKLEEVQKLEHPDIKGVYDIEYRLKVEIKDYRGQGTGEFKFVPKEGVTPLKKTVYDPNVISNEEIVKLGKEAMDEGLNNNRKRALTTQNKEKIYGISSEGLKFEGIRNIETGEIDNFFPVIEFEK
ncbi:TopI - like protein YobL [Bacillus nakamurai]|uniref:T7SS effector LXG polymorphic toxin n=1 Tax=Bacillus nakamurai TaxID=1793963 RepID=UPI0007786FBF|nr:T7SS effector LXG polymorphic toxin [Bacillus nakamurai]KXZ20705.1 TopI - like protein YobL [Bacillus nakamurai]